MVCAVTFVDGRVHFRSKFVSSFHRRQESQAKRMLYNGQMGTNAAGAGSQSLRLAMSLLKGQKPKLKFRNPSNTSVFYWGGKVMHWTISDVVLGCNVFVYKGVDNL